MKKYEPKKIEGKWQKVWDKSGIYEAKDKSTKPKWYSLIEFPYPSANGLHTGHIRSNTAMDIISRKRRMEGYNVLYPIGWDAFGLPTENYAIKTGIHPVKVTKKNTDIFRKQLKSVGFSFDWSREINTSDPAYYKWTQWIFLQLFKKGLAYKQKTLINWCPKDLCGLANEEVINGKCERCGTDVIKKEKEQWMLAITKYADRLDKDLDLVDYLPAIKQQQRNWIGRSEGTEIEFELKSQTEPTFYQYFDASKIREIEPFVEREVILAVVKHWSEDKYIGLKWKKVDWDTFVTGGVEDGQTPEQAAIAEIQEETGYKNLKLVKNLGRIHTRFYHVPKKQNRFGHFDVFYFQLKNGERADISAEEQKNHDVVWLTKDELENFRLPSSHRYVWEMIQNKGKAETKKVTVFTTRPDTLFGVTYLVLSPEHPLVSHFIHQSANASEINDYIEKTKKETDTERTAEGKEKTGVLMEGVKAINPANGEEVPVFIADYVLASYGTGAVMAVPAHDDRDYAFAQKYGLPIKEVIIPNRIDKRNPPVVGKKTVERQTVHAIVFNPKTQKYLCLKWKKHPWTTFPMGGVEARETVIEAARREVMEETGYKNLSAGKILGGQVRAEYFAAHKDQNRTAFTSAVYFELDNEVRNEVSQEEKDAYDITWVGRESIDPITMTHAEMDVWLDRLDKTQRAYVDYGVLINSGEFNGQTSEKAIKAITKFVHGKTVTKYKLRDWVFSRQRYWGEPIPLVFCEHCAARTNTDLTRKKRGKDMDADQGEIINPGWIAVPEKDLPVVLPNVKNYQPSDDGESPLSRVPKWVNTKCPVCGGKATRETDTMPNWAGSSWYSLRYIDPKNTKSVADFKKLQYWQPVDWYNGGAEHITLHLLYSRFWNKFLYDIGVIPALEPYQKRTTHGMILGDGGIKMSKSKGNVVNPDETVKNYGADSLRVYEMFMGPFDQSIAWSTESIIGSRRFLDKVWNIAQKVSKIKPEESTEIITHKTIKKVTEDIESMSFNTAISAMMVWANELDKQERVPTSVLAEFLKILAPFAPHLTEELWSNLGNKKSIHLEKWPTYDSNKLKEKIVKIVLQINGKVRDSFEIQTGLKQTDVEAMALSREIVKKWIDGKTIKKIVYIPDKLLNIVV